MGTAGPAPGTTTGGTSTSDPTNGDSGGEIRVEELARRAEVSVDTIRFYQKRQLLPPPRRAGRIAWYGADHVERLGRIKDLQRQGFSLAVIRRLLAGELDAADVPLAAAVAGAQTGDAELLTLDELAARVGVPAPLLDAVAREGLIVAQQRDGAAGYTAADADVLRAGLRLLEAGFPLPDLLALARRHHDATRAIAADAVEMFDEHVRRPIQTSDLDDDVKAERLVEAFRTLLPTVTTLVANHFRSVLLEVAQEHLEAVGDPRELAAARGEAGWDHS
jgi:DNA-binding transcriptional MerR regulator